jgi:hypothetical protein
MKKIFIRDIPLLSLLLIILQFNINTEYFIQKYPTASWEYSELITKQKTVLSPNCPYKNYTFYLPDGRIDWNATVDCYESNAYTTIDVPINVWKTNESSGNNWTDNCSDAQIFHDNKNFKCSDHYKINNFLPFIILILLFSTLIYLAYRKDTLILFEKLDL